MDIRIRAIVTTVVLASSTGACDLGVGPSEPEAQLASVSPLGERSGWTVTLTLTEPMMSGMEAYWAVHQGDGTGPVTAGTWAWSAGGTSLTLTPAAPLAAGTQCTIHVRVEG